MREDYRATVGAGGEQLNDKRSTSEGESRNVASPPTAGAGTQDVDEFQPVHHGQTGRVSNGAREQRPDRPIPNADDGADQGERGRSGEYPDGPSQAPVSDRSSEWQAVQSGSHEESPTPHAPLAGLVGRARFVVLVAVAAVMLVALALFVLGAGLAVTSVVHAVYEALRGNLNARDLTVQFLEIVSIMFKAVVFYLIGVGFYSLFIAPLNITAAIGVDTLNDLEIKIVSVVIVIMAVTFLEHFILWQQIGEVLLYGISMGIVIAALVFFQKQCHRESLELRHEDAGMRETAQRELFHREHEEREVGSADERAARSRSSHSGAKAGASRPER
ncbi:MAG: YqhA family protein [Chloroflexi bacterium]|nr:YqhA family protein [Chloroflexota bacterium]